MGEILKNKAEILVRRCKVCGKLEGENDDLLLRNLEEMIDLTEEEEAAWEWFSEKVEETKPKASTSSLTESVNSADGSNELPNQILVRPAAVARIAAPLFK